MDCAYKEVMIMFLEQWLRLVAGVFVLASLGLSQVHSPYWLCFTGFVGFSLFQSGFTNWCPMMWILKRLGVREK